MISGKRRSAARGFGSWRVLSGALSACSIWGATVGGAYATPQFKLLYAFQGGVDGAIPYVGHVDRNAGVVYGTTYNGGSASCDVGCGTIFSLTPTDGTSAWTKATLLTFQGGSDGKWPTAGLTMDDNGSFYGMTTEGGGSRNCIIDSTILGCGTVYRLDPPEPGGTSWSETVLYRFQAGYDGAFPEGGVVADRHGVLFGTTAYGGISGSFGSGIVFSLRPPGQGQTVWTESVLYRFAGGAQGGRPESSVYVDESSDALFGTTRGGGGGGVAGNTGTAFMVAPPAQGQTTWTHSVLYSFRGGSDGGKVAAPLIGMQGAFYGVTQEGGGNRQSCKSGTIVVGCGTMYALVPPTNGQANWTETVRYNFKGDKDGNFPDVSLIKDKTGALYGTTSAGGGSTYCKDGTRPTGCGTIFKLTPPAPGQSVWTETVLYRFAGKYDGGIPDSRLYFDRYGNLYGSTFGGGTYDAGTVFQLSGTGFSPP